MSVTTDTRLTSRQRLARGLTYSTVGPVDVARGAVGISARSVAATVGSIRRRYRSGRLRRELAAAQQTIGRELAVVTEAVSGLPQMLQDAQATQHRRTRPWLLAAAVGTVALAGGAVAFSIIRRSSKPEPSTLPPSVQVDPKP
jgi:Cell wall synthesis protein CwsA